MCVSLYSFHRLTYIGHFQTFDRLEARTRTHILYFVVKYTMYVYAQLSRSTLAHPKRKTEHEPSNTGMCFVLAVKRRTVGGRPGRPASAPPLIALLCGRQEHYF